MKKILLFFCFTMLGMVNMMADGSVPDYDMTGAGSGNSGTVLVKVYVYAKKVTDEDIKRCAVHGVVFRGCTGNNSGASQPAMTSAAKEAEMGTFCKEFFSGSGECQNYATIVAGSYDRVKTQKGYKSGAIVQVDKTALRKTLEKAGLVRSLSSGF